LPYQRYYRFPALRRLYEQQMHRRHSADLAQVLEREKVDVLHIPSPVEADYFPDAGDALPTLVTVHDLIPLLLPDIYINTWMDIHREVYHRQNDACREMTCVVAISEATKQDTVNLLSIPPERCVVIPNGIPDVFGDWLQDTDALSALWNRLGFCPPYFVYSSGSGANKNLENTLAGYAEYYRSTEKPLPFVLAGKWSPELMQGILKQGTDLGLSSGALRFTGLLSDTELWYLTASATAQVVVSLHEGFGMPAAEAMSVGTPVLASNTSSLPEVVGAAGILVPPTDIAAIAQGLHTLATDPERCLALGKLGRERFLQHFTTDKQAEQFIALYNRLGMETGFSGGENANRV
jgi:glycosyltransferase involved in cell wall biosynthesis